MTLRQASLFESERLSLSDAINVSIDSLRAYGNRYRHWAIAYSGGKDSTATVAFVLWAIAAGRVNKPDSLTVLYADTRMEFPPLQQAAMKFLDKVSSEGYNTRVVVPDVEKRFFVYMLGRGVPPPKNRFRWCTPMLKITPMMDSLENIRLLSGEKLLMLTGVRIGESEIRDKRIALSCSRDDGECGQGWYQMSTPEAIADTLAPLLHWRLCHIYDWLYFDLSHGYDVSGIAAIYGEENIRTGCVGCNLASDDKTLKRLIRSPEWEHLKPLLGLRVLYRELKKARHRVRKATFEINKDGKIGKNPQRMGPLTMEARQYGLETVLDIQRQAKIDLINPEEEALIRQMWLDNVWPEKWSENDIPATVPLDALYLENGRLITQALLVK